MSLFSSAALLGPPPTKLKRGDLRKDVPEESKVEKRAQSALVKIVGHVEGPFLKQFRSNLTVVDEECRLIGALLVNHKQPLGKFPFYILARSSHRKSLEYISAVEAVLARLPGIIRGGMAHLPPRRIWQELVCPVIHPLKRFLQDGILKVEEMVESGIQFTKRGYWANWILPVAASASRIAIIMKGTLKEVSAIEAIHDWSAMASPLPAALPPTEVEIQLSPLHDGSPSYPVSSAPSVNRIEQGDNGVGLEMPGLNQKKKKKVKKEVVDKKDKKRGKRLVEDRDRADTSSEKGLHKKKQKVRIPKSDLDGATKKSALALLMGGVPIRYEAEEKKKKKKNKMKREDTI